MAQKEAGPIPQPGLVRDRHCDNSAKSRHLCEARQEVHGAFRQVLENLGGNGDGEGAFLEG
jgi:hypothetical protein